MTQDDAAKSAPTLGSLSLFGRMPCDNGLQLEPGWLEKTAARATAEVESWSDDKYELVCSMFPELRNRRRDPRKSSKDWIPVGDRLPEPGQRVIATVRSYVGEAWHVDGSWSIGKLGRVDGVTHWMPLPVAPVPS